MSLVVRQVRTRSDFRHFLRLQADIYRNDPCWVPQLRGEVRKTLDTRKNPYFVNASLALFVAFRDSTPVSRVSVVVNRSYRPCNGKRPALFGFFESQNDVHAATALFRAAGNWSSAHGAETLHGPFHPHHYSEMGVQCTGFNTRPSFFQTHHPSYYHQLLKESGFVVERFIHTRRNPEVRSFLEQRRKIQLRSGSLRIRTIDYRDLSNELERIRLVFNDAFSDNCYFLPLSREEYSWSAASFRLITRPELNVIVEHNNEPVGALQGVLDINPLIASARSGRATPWDIARFLYGRRTIRRLIVFAVGIKKKWQGTRVHALLFNALSDMAMNFDELETTWMSPDNPIALHAAERFGLEPDKQFAMYTRPAYAPSGHRS